MKTVSVHGKAGKWLQAFPAEEDRAIRRGEIGPEPGFSSTYKEYKRSIVKKSRKGKK